MAFLPDKPAHGKFALRNLNSTQYKTYARQYSRAKAGLSGRNAIIYLFLFLLLYNVTK
jgi:hypothetical protein